LIRKNGNDVYKAQLL